MSESLKGLFHSCWHVCLLLRHLDDFVLPAWQVQLALCQNVLGQLRLYWILIQLKYLQEIRKVNMTHRQNNACIFLSLSHENKDIFILLIIEIPKNTYAKSLIHDNWHRLGWFYQIKEWWSPQQYIPYCLRDRKSCWALQ